MLSNPRRNARRLVAAASLAIVGVGAACAPMPPAPADISHLSKWTNASFSSPVKGTELTVSAGIDDPAGGHPFKTVEVSLAQSFCDGSTQVSRELQGTSSTFAGVVDSAIGVGSVSASLTLAGTETRTPAGEGCTAPTGSGVTTPLSIGATVNASVTGVGEVLTYTREDTGAYRYQDATAIGSLSLAGEGSGISFLGAVEGSSWIWQGFWADARGIDVASLIP